MSKDERPSGYNIQIQKQTDIAGGAETVVMNCHMPAESSEQAIYERIQKMRKAIQREIEYNAGLEQARQDAERRREEHGPGTATVVPLRSVPDDGANGKLPTDA